VPTSEQCPQGHRDHECLAYGCADRRRGGIDADSTHPAVTAGTRPLLRPRLFRNLPGVSRTALSGCRPAARPVAGMVDSEPFGKRSVARRETTAWLIRMACRPGPGCGVGPSGPRRTACDGRQSISESRSLGVPICRYVRSDSVIHSASSRRWAAEREAGIRDGWSRSRCGRITRVNRRPDDDNSP
jgi:hypothetical protein